MQPLLGSPRDGLNPDLVTDVLTSDPSITVTYGAEWYNSRLAFVQDVTSFMSDGSSITSDVFARIHRSCTMMFDSDVPFNYITDFVKPYMTLTNNDTGFAARFNLGVYTMQTPQMDNSTRPSVLSFAGYDLLYLLDQPIADSYEMQLAVDPVDIAAGLIATAVPGASVQFTSSGEVTVQVTTWPFDSQNSFSYLDVVNTMLAMVGYPPVWVDWNGVFQLQPYVDPQTAPVEWTFNLSGADNIVAEGRTSQQDFFDVPNWWRFVMQNLTAAPVEGVSQITYLDESTNPGSVPNRGREVRRVFFVNATSFDALFAQAVIQITNDLSPAETFNISTSPFPLAWHRDVIALDDPNIGTQQPSLSPFRRVQANQWTLPLDGTADMTWTLQTVNTGPTAA